jgi:glycosyltransferase involved in cell wall biosynthesis
MLAKSYPRIGVNVEVVSLDEPHAPFLQDFPCTVHALGQSYLGRFAFSPRLWRWLLANAGHYDAIVMNGMWTFPGLSLFCVTRRTKTRYGVFTHGALDPWFNRAYRLKHLKKILYWPFQYTVLRYAMAVFFTTDAELNLAKTSFWPNAWNSLVVPYGIYDPELDGSDPGHQIEAFYARFPQLRGRRFLLFLGRIHEKKGCDFLLEAFSRNREAAPDLNLVMAGPDQVGMRAKLEDRVGQLGLAGMVHWTGMIGGDPKWGALRACEAFVLPSHQENFGISVVEALAVGRPVLISNQVNIWHQVVEDGVGLVEEDTLAGTSSLLRRWVDLEPCQRTNMAALARACFLSRFNISHTVVTIKALFDSDAGGEKTQSA